MAKPNVDCGGCVLRDAELAVFRDELEKVRCLTADCGKCIACENYRLANNEEHLRGWFLTLLRENAFAIYDAWKSEKCPGTWPDFLADYLKKMMMNENEEDGGESPSAACSCGWSGDTGWPAKDDRCPECGNGDLELLGKEIR